MIKVAGLWETGWFAPISEIALWKHPLKEFGVDHLIMSPVSGILADTSQTFMSEYSQIENVITDARNDGLTMVFVDESADTELPDFVHPTNVLYVLGKTRLSPYLLFYNPELGDMAVKIPTTTNGGRIWGHQAATMVLYDRFLKA